MRTSGVVCASLLLPPAPALLTRFLLMEWLCLLAILSHVAVTVHHEQGGYTDVPPIAGRCIFFNSLHQHEVLPNTGARDRWALTMWVYREDADASKFTIS
jgi:hypothetical protein